MYVSTVSSLRLTARFGTALACAAAMAAATAGPVEDANKKLVLDFHQIVLNGGDVEAAPNYVANSYVQHNPKVPDGLAGLQGIVRELRKGAPDAHSVVKHVVAEGDLVVLHSHTQRNAQDRGMAQVDIFRVRGGKIVEHWDVIQPIPETSVNTNTMF